MLLSTVLKCVKTESAKCNRIVWILYMLQLHVTRLLVNLFGSLLLTLKVAKFLLQKKKKRNLITFCKTLQKATAAHENCSA